MNTFKKGERVNVLLDETHNMVDDPIKHPATFVGEHADGKWADVDLDTEHTGKTRRLSVPLSIISKVAALLLFALLSFSPRAQAQFEGYVGLQTVATQFSNQTCTGSAQTFSVPNLGQISHQASATTNAGSFLMEIDGVDNIGTAYRISQNPVTFANTGGTSYVAQAYGYYAVIRISITCSAAATFSLSYSGGQTAFNVIAGAPGTTPVPVGGITNNVQGVVASQQSASTVNPIINGSVQSPINSGLLTAGVDNFGIQQTSVPSGGSGQFTIGVVPTPTVNTETAVAFDANFADVGAGTSILAPWTCQPVTGNSACAGSSGASIATLANAPAGQVLRRSYSNASTGGGAGGELNAIVLFSGTATFRQGNTNGVAVNAYPGNTLAGSTMIGAARCSGTTPCTITSVTDTQGNTWLPVVSTTRNGTQVSGLFIFVSPNLSTAAANTVTFTVGTGAVAGTTVVELTGTTPSQLVNPAIANLADQVGQQVVRLDAQSPNQFNCNVALSTNTTLQCQAAPTTINGVNARLYVTDFQINTTVAGTTSTLQLKTGTGTNCGTGTLNLSAITYADTVIGLTNVIGFRTPLVAPTQNAVCVTQAGAAAGTTTVEIHGFIAP